jgi:hypothetical protein
MVMSYDSNGRPLKKMRDGEPCEDGAKCLGHVTHPCETCGRVVGKVSTLDYRIALLNYEWEGGSPLIDGSDIHQMLMHSEEREQITIYRRLLGERGIQLLDHEVA